MREQEKSPEITLNYSGEYFAKENFECSVVAGTYAPIFKQLRSDFSLKSTNYQILQPDKTFAYHIRKEAFGEKMAYLSEKNFITVEKGTAGFDFEEKVFVVTAVPNGDGFSIDITESQDAALIEELMAIVCTENRSSAKDYVKWCFSCMTLPQKDAMSRGLQNYMDFVEGKLSRLQNTRFLDMDPEDDAHEFLYIDNQLETQFNNISLDYQMKNNFFFKEKRLFVQAENGSFMPYARGCFDDKAAHDIGILKLDSDNGRKEFLILEPVEFLHDIDAHMWLKTRVKYRYPQDAVKIAEEHPKLYREATKEKELWRDISPMDEEPKPPVLGEMEMYVPCENVRNLWSMRNSPFHFLDRPGAAIRYGKGQILHSDEGKFGLFFVSHGGEEYFARYKKEGRKRFGRDVYNHYTFYDFLPLSDLLANPDKDFETYVLNCTYQMEVIRSGIKSTPIDEATFDMLDMAKREEPLEDKNTPCPLLKGQLPPTPPIPQLPPGLRPPPLRNLPK